MKHKLIKSGKVLETLFSGNEVLHISFSPKGNVKAERLSKVSIENVRDIIKEEDKTGIFLALIEVTDTEEPTEPETPSEPPEQTEVPENPETPPETEENAENSEETLEVE